MKKIPTLFVRDFSGEKPVLTNEVHPDCRWVVDGEGVATEKYDGMCCLFQGGHLYRRYNYKEGRNPKEGWIPAQPDPDENGNWPGWVLVDFAGPSDKWHFDALANMMTDGIGMRPGTYELVGPKVNNNAYGLDSHVLLPHGGDEFHSCPRSFVSLLGWLGELPIEGVVWHHPDGRMAKLKRRDFGFDWPRIRGISGVEEVEPRRL